MKRTLGITVGLFAVVWWIARGGEDIATVDLFLATCCIVAADVLLILGEKEQDSGHGDKH